MDLRSRNVFSNQPGHSVLIDLSPPIPPDLLTSVTNTLTNILQLADKMRGSIRIPAFGLYVISTEFHAITKLNALKNNWTTISNGITTLKQITLSSFPTQEEFEDNLNLAFQCMINDVTNLPSVFKNQNNSCPSDIEITFVTMKDPDIIMTSITAIITNMAISKLKNIQIIPLSQLNKIKMNVNPSIDFIQIIRLPLTTYFRSWLLDYKTNPDVILKFPDQMGKFELFCNLQECVLNPASIPYSHAFQLQSDELSIQLGSSSRNSSFSATLPIHKLEIINRLSQEALCDVSEIGIPHCITATNSWQLNAEQAKENKDRFNALCYTLGTKDECLLARQYYDDKNVDSHVYGRFVIIPGDNLMVIRALAVSELMQPFNINRIIEKPNESALAFISSTLSRISVLSEYNPEEHKSGLFDVLTNTPNISNSQRKTQNVENLNVSKNLPKKPKRTKIVEPDIHPALMNKEDIENIIQNKRKNK